MKRSALLALVVMAAVLGGCKTKPPEDPDLTQRKKLFEQAAHELPVMLEAAKEKGLFTLPKYKPIPASQNGAPLFKMAIAEHKELPALRSALFLPTAKQADMARELRSHAKELDLLRKASHFPKADFGPMVDGWDMGREWVTGLGSGAHVLSLDARYRAVTGDKATALEDLKAIEQIAFDLKDDQRDFSQLITAGTVESLNKCIQQIIDHFSDPNSARQLLEIVVKEPMPPGLKVALPHELATVYPDISSDLYTKISNPESPVHDSFENVIAAIQGVPGESVRDGFRERLLEMFLHLSAAASVPGFSIVKQMPMVQQASQPEEDGDPTHALNSAAFGDQWTTLLITTLSSMVRKEVTMVGLKILAGHKGGGWPKALPTGTPLDPYTNTPLRYRSSSTGFIVYSILLGDNGGDLKDLGFRYPSGWEVESNKPPVKKVLGSRQP
ncbi:MAG TPA: hypothetical protein VGL56_06955 [Fimbriimonadaceae bacterium]